MEEDGIENNFPADFRTRETADLFLVLIIELLKPGGRAAVVLPDGTLFGEGVKTRIKERLLAECDLHTIVRLPKGVFAPYTRSRPMCSSSRRAGRPRRSGTTSTRTRRATSRTPRPSPCAIEEFEPEKAWWGNRVENEFAWRVTVEEIRERGFNLDIANPNAPGMTHDDPDELLARFEKERAAAAALREQLRQVLAAALAGGRGMTPQDLIAAFDELAEAPDGVTRLRELVLQLAVRGKLVPQDPDDEPASVLLERIAGRRPGW